MVINVLAAPHDKQSIDLLRRGDTGPKKTQGSNSKRPPPPVYEMHNYEVRSIEEAYTIAKHLPRKQGAQIHFAGETDASIMFTEAMLKLLGQFGSLPHHSFKMHMLTPQESDEQRGIVIELRPRDFVEGDGGASSSHLQSLSLQEEEDDNGAKSH